MGTFEVHLSGSDRSTGSEIVEDLDRLRRKRKEDPNVGSANYDLATLGLAGEREDFDEVWQSVGHSGAPRRDRATADDGGLINFRQQS